MIGGSYEVVYRGERLPSGRVRVTRFWRDDQGDLHVEPLRHRVRHSPDGFEWGFAGSGPADLARSLLWDAIYREPDPDLYQTFKREIVARFARAGWALDQKNVQGWVQDVLRRRGVVL